MTSKVRGATQGQPWERKSPGALPRHSLRHNLSIMPKPKFSVTVSLTMPKETLDRIDAIAKAKRQSRSKAARLIIEAGLKAMGK